MTSFNVYTTNGVKEEHLSNGYHVNGHSSASTDDVNAGFLSCLDEPYIYSTGNPGKAIRDQTIAAMNKWLNVDSTILQKISQLIKILHESSLMIDDIQDNSKMRRGKPTAYQIYGISEVINIANMKYFEAGRIALELGHMTADKTINRSEASRIFHDWMIKLHQGQGLDIYWRDHFICPTEEQYVDMVLKKTGGLMMLAFDLMYLFRDKSHDSGSIFSYKTGRHFLETYSKFFQIRDDFCNLWDEKYAKNKSYCEDFTEGKFSWVIIQGINKEKELGTTKIMSVLKQRTTSDSVKKYCCQFLESLGVKSNTMTYLKMLQADLEIQLSELGGGDLFSKIIDLLSIDNVKVL